MGEVSIFQVIVVLCCFFLIYIFLLPTIIALKKSHQDRTSIILINILLGWFLIGWVVALVWALKKTEIGNVGHADELEKLYSLKEKGIITEDEFSRKKASLIS
jgi:uncharacterized membrane protein